MGVISLSASVGSKWAMIEPGSSFPVRDNLVGNFLEKLGFSLKPLAVISLELITLILPLIVASKLGGVESVAVKISL